MTSSPRRSTGVRILLAAGLFCLAASASAGDRRDHGRQSVRVDVQMYGQGELNIKRWLEKYARIDTDHYYLTGVVVHANGRHRGPGGHALLRIGSNYSPRIGLRPGSNHIQAPRYDDGKWRLYVREGAYVHAVTLLIEPRWRHGPGRNYDRGYDHDYERRFDRDYERNHDRDYRHNLGPQHGSPLGPAYQRSRED